MADLIITSAQPNPPGHDAARPGVTTNAKLNEEWVEFTVQRDRALIDDQLSHLTFNNYCQQIGLGSPVPVSQCPGEVGAARARAHG